MSLYPSQSPGNLDALSNGEPVCNINRPVFRGGRRTRHLPVASIHVPALLAGDSNGVKVTVMLEELLAEGTGRGVLTPG